MKDLITSKVFIPSLELFVEDHGILTFFVHCELIDEQGNKTSSVQGYGGYSLDYYDKEIHQRIINEEKIKPLIDKINNFFSINITIDNLKEATNNYKDSGHSGKPISFLINRNFHVIKQLSGFIQMLINTSDGQLNILNLSESLSAQYGTLDEYLKRIDLKKSDLNIDNMPADEIFHNNPISKHILNNHFKREFLPFIEKTIMISDIAEKTKLESSNKNKIKL